MDIGKKQYDDTVSKYRKALADASFMEGSDLNGSNTLLNDIIAEGSTLDRAYKEIERCKNAFREYARQLGVCPAIYFYSGKHFSQNGELLPQEAEYS